MPDNQNGMDKPVRICVAIGVSRPERLDELPGVIAAAESIAEWARSLKYETALVTDKRDPVTCARLKETIEALVAKPDEERARVIISFAGHGVTSGTRDLWLLSRWYTEPDEIVDVELMRMRLATYRPRQVTIISDACRTPPPEDDPTIQGSRILSRSPWEATEPDCDVLLATGIGKPAYMVRAKENSRAYCLFTHVVTNALWGRYADAIDQTHSQGPAVTSQTLKKVLRRELPLAANLLNQSQSASIVTNFTPPDDIYTPMGGNGAPPPPAVTLEPPARPPAFGVRGGPPTSGTDHERRGGAKSPKEVADAFRRSLVDEAPLRPTHFETGTGLAVVGDRIAAVASAPGIASFPDTSPTAPADSRGRWWVLHGPPTSLAVQLTLSGRWVCACLYPRMISTFTVDKAGAASLVFRPAWSGSSYSSATEEAIAAMRAGTVMDETALDLAARIREWKHVDPVLGVIASYLYARAGDLENVRRIAWFYCQHQQPIPFDVALLGGLRLERNGPLLRAQVPATSERRARVAAEESRTFTTVATPSAEGLVGGGIPWLRQGWSLLEDSRESVLAPLLQFAGGLTPALFTTLEPSAGEALADLIRKGEI
jgi:hypothetical protein